MTGLKHPIQYPIEIEGLTKKYRDNMAVDNVNLKVPAGSVFGFLGPNGAGKTTTIKILTGLISATSGRAKVFEQAVTTEISPDLKQSIGYLAQEPVFPPQLTGTEVMAMVAETYRLQGKEWHDRANGLLQEFDLLPAANRRVGAYSRGMRQRLGIATVLLPAPPLMILDEPASALDPQGRYEVLEMVSRLRGEATVFFSSHILADVERVCDWVAIIDRGQILKQSRLGDLLDEYTGLHPGYFLRLLDRGTEAAQELTREDWVMVAEVGDDNGVTVRTTAGQYGLLQEGLVAALVTRGYTVTELRPLKPDLEEIFLALTAKREGVER